MGRSQESFRKKEQNKKREQKKKEKELRKENRQSNSDKGKTLEDMFAYVDEFGNITNEKPEEVKKSTVKLEDIQISIPKMTEEDQRAAGTVHHVNEEKGYGFIHDERHQRIFFLLADAPQPLKLNERVTFELQKSPKGLQAIHIERIVKQ
ncbi:cold shock domain-containing protein [Olivibacter ginsenosidimutans]|uniref:Cold shock domain-containing protein n=1 Tax=Olivibacter ginsenosidimutans TaxID=1176537 RepID=A0ABP9AZ23_9SPHI